MQPAPRAGATPATSYWFWLAYHVEPPSVAAALHPAPLSDLRGNCVQYSHQRRPSAMTCYQYWRRTRRERPTRRRTPRRRRVPCPICGQLTCPNYSSRAVPRLLRVLAPHWPRAPRAPVEALMATRPTATLRRPRRCLTETILKHDRAEQLPIRQPHVGQQPAEDGLGRMALVSAACALLTVEEHLSAGERRAAVANRGLICSGQCGR